MSFDGANFNDMILAELTRRTYRLLNDAAPLATETEPYRALHEKLLNRPPRVPTDAREDWQIIVMAIIAVRDELVKAALPYRRQSIEHRGTHEDFFDLATQLDERENEFRTLLRLPPTTYDRDAR